MKEGYSKSSYPAVDLFKFVCCILVIAIHTKPFEPIFWLDAAVGLITRFAVPFFFVSSGFFFFRSQKNGRTRSKFIKYEKRLFILYLIWYIIQNLFSYARGYRYSPVYYVRHFIWPNNGSILWFLPAIMYSVLMVYLLSKYLSAKKIFALSLFFWEIGYCMSTLQPLFDQDGIILQIQNTIGIQNGLFFGFPYIAMANLFAEQRGGYDFSIKKSVIGLICSFCGLGIEAIVVVLLIKPNLTFLWFFALPMTFFVFQIAIMSRISNSSIFMTMRKISTLIYVIHPMVLSAIPPFFEITNIQDSLNILLFLTVTVVSILLALFIYWLSKHERLAFLNYLM